MIDIHLTAQEAHALYNVTAGIMRRGAGTPELGSVARKLRGKVAAIVCCRLEGRLLTRAVSALLSLRKENRGSASLRPGTPLQRGGAAH